jgi:cytochrome P450
MPTETALPTTTTPRRIRDLPGPRGLPFLGQALSIEPSRLHLQAEAWAREYGSAYRWRIAGREFVTLADPQAVAAVLRDRPEGFRRTPRLSEIADELGFSGLFSANGERWKRQRPMVMASFDPTHTRAYFPTLARVTERLAGRWHGAAARKESIDLQADLMRYTVDVTAGLAFGADINTLESDDEIIQNHLDRIFPALQRRLLAPVSYWHHIKFKADRELDHHVEALRVAVAGFIAQARERLAADPSRREHPQNLIETMVVERDREGSLLDDADVSGNVLTMLLAGEDTTANTLAWLVYLLHRHPEAQATARAEVDRVIGPGGVPARHEQLAELPVLEACANEAMRLKPVAPVILAQALRDTVVADIAIPKGTILMLLMRPGAVDAERFPDPERFDPQRWLDGGTGVPAPTSARRASMPFGAGPRLCPGRYLAMQEIKAALAMLLARFEIVAVDTPDGGEPEERMEFTMFPVGLKLRLAPRG